MPTNKTYECNACGHDHPQGEMPVLCHNVIQLADAVANWMTGEDSEEEQKQQILLDVCDRIVHGPKDDEEDEGEVFN